MKPAVPISNVMVVRMLELAAVGLSVMCSGGLWRLLGISRAEQRDAPWEPYPRHGPAIAKLECALAWHPNFLSQRVSGGEGLCHRSPHQVAGSARATFLTMG